MKKLWETPPTIDFERAAPGYTSTVLRAPRQPLFRSPEGPLELAAPRFDKSVLFTHHDDLTRQGKDEAQGERIIVEGCLRDREGEPIRNAFIEIWQCNAAGRYHHDRDQHDAPLDPNFTGNGRVFTDKNGNYRFTTIKPGAYPWKNHDNAWRPAHIHFSVHGNNSLQRLVTQMYFPNDPLLGYDTIFGALPSDKVRDRLVSSFELSITQPEWALGYRFDIVLDGPDATPAQPD
jgi:protocatechuate 3,4-dioxygenase beta subunit